MCMLDMGSPMARAPGAVWREALPPARRDDQDHPIAEESGRPRRLAISDTVYRMALMRVSSVCELVQLRCSESGEGEGERERERERDGWINLYLAVFWCRVSGRVRAARAGSTPPRRVRVPFARDMSVLRGCKFCHCRVAPLWG